MAHGGEVLGVAEAYDAYRGELVGYLYQLTRDMEAAEDLLHEAYLRLMAEAGRGRAPLNARAWLYRVARNLATSRGRRLQVVQRNSHRLQISESTASTEDQCVSREADDYMRKMLSTLVPIDRRCLLMAAHGYTSAEIARVVGGTQSAVRTRIFRVRTGLRLRISRDFGISGDVPATSAA